MLLRERTVRRVLILDLDVHQARARLIRPRDACSQPLTLPEDCAARSHAAPTRVCVVCRECSVACTLPVGAWQWVARQVKAEAGGSVKRHACLQGDGTAFIFQGRPEVFTFSVHGEGNFPARKQAGLRLSCTPCFCSWRLASYS